MSIAAGMLIAGTAVSAIVKAIQLMGVMYTDAKRAESYVKDYSLIDSSAPARVEPLTIVGADCVHLEYTPEVLQSLLSIFAGYYLQAVSLTVQVNGVSASKLLDKLNPVRQADAITAALSTVDMVGSAANRVGQYSSSWKSNNQSYEHRLPTFGNQKAVAFEHQKIALEEINNYQESPEEERRRIKWENEQIDRANKLEKEEAEAQAVGDEQKRDKSLKRGALITDNQIKSISEITNLSVGRMFNVSLAGGVSPDGTKQRDVVMPIVIRLMVNNINEQALVSLLCTGSMDNSIKERYHAYKSGRISFIRDLILCQDLIDEHRKAMINDHSGVHSQIIERVNNNKLAGLASKDPSLNTASNLFVISEATAAVIESKLGGKLSNPHTREKIFSSGYAMIIAVIDRRYERVTFYHRGISTSTNVSLRDIKASNKGGGSDVADIMKAFILGNGPQL